MIPHSISVDEGRHIIYVADRENGRMQSFDFNGTLQSVWTKDQFAPKLFAVYYHKATGRHYDVFASVWNWRFKRYGDEEIGSLITR
jgi:NHL repeat